MSKATNLFLPEWRAIEQGELRVILEEIFGGPGQTDALSHGERKYFLPLAGAEARICISVEEKSITALEPGPALDAARWDKAATELGDAVNPRAFGVARAIAFSTRRVRGSWRGPESGLQISPPPEDAPDSKYEGADHPFILEVPFAHSAYQRVEAHRIVREIRRTVLLLNAMLAGRISVPPLRSRHLWAMIDREGAAFEMAWVKEAYWTRLPDGADYLEPSNQRLPEIPLAEYFKVRGNDGTGLKIPDDLDAATMRFRQLSSELRAKFDRAIFWFDQASRSWDSSMSASFAALVSSLEALTGRGDTHKFVCPVCNKNTQHEVPGATRRFIDLIKGYGGGGSEDSNAIYALRSEILHGSGLVQLDDSFAFNWADPVFRNESELHTQLWSLTQAVLRNWLTDPPRYGSGPDAADEPDTIRD